MNDNIERIQRKFNIRRGVPNIGPYWLEITEAALDQVFDRVMVKDIAVLVRADNDNNTEAVRETGNKFFVEISWEPPLHCCTDPDRVDIFHYCETIHDINKIASDLANHTGASCSYCGDWEDGILCRRCLELGISLETNPAHV